MDVPIYHSYGVDDIGSSIDYLCDEGHWRRGEGTVQAPEFEFSGKREKLIAKIEEEGLHRDLAGIVTDVYREIEEAVAVKRRPRYV